MHTLTLHFPSIMIGICVGIVIAGAIIAMGILLDQPRADEWEGE